MATSAASTATSQAGAATSEPAAGQPAPSPNEMLIVMRVSNWKWGLGKSPQLDHVIEKAKAGLVGLTADDNELLYVVTTDHDAACSLADELEGRPAAGGGPMMRTAIATAACWLRGKDALHDEAPTGTTGNLFPLPLAFAAPAPTPRGEPEQAARKEAEPSVASASAETEPRGVKRAIDQVDGSADDSRSAVWIAPAGGSTADSREAPTDVATAMATEQLPLPGHLAQPRLYIPRREAKRGELEPEPCFKPTLISTGPQSDPQAFGPRAIQSLSPDLVAKRVLPPHLTSWKLAPFTGQIEYHEEAFPRTMFLRRAWRYDNILPDDPDGRLGCLRLRYLVGSMVPSANLTITKVAVRPASTYGFRIDLFMIDDDMMKKFMRDYSDAARLTIEGWGVTDKEQELLELGARQSAAKRLGIQAAQAHARGGPALSVKGTAANAVAIGAGRGSTGSSTTDKGDTKNEK
ncbi:hypothetical protein B0A53_03987 [Rhodotorula sp. CCFEE 5036]|nr:hypothetical protein B0A53_03987 [Rhodotorula sp. CCFEE 5036]